jgi:anti-sigma regulatory factor (Ser/Thr protein kinase)
VIQERRFPGELASSIAVRQWVRAEAREVPLQVTDAIVVVVTELASNAIRHARTAFTVRLSRTDGAVRVEVHDTGTGTPTERLVGPTDITGRGLQIVAALSDEWGVVAEPNGSGKTVWAAFRFSDTGSPPDSLRQRREGDRGDKTTDPGISSGHVVCTKMPLVA